MSAHRPFSRLGIQGTRLRASSGCSKARARPRWPMSARRPSRASRRISTRPRWRRRSPRDIDYIFLGNKLGGRPGQPAMYTKGVADYGKMAASNEFRAGIALLTEAAGRRRVAAMCSEADPLDCHRCLLVARALAGDGRGGCSHSFLGGGHAAPRGRGSAARSRRSRRAWFAARVARRAAGRSLSCPRPQSALMPFGERLRGELRHAGASQYPEWLA